MPQLTITLFADFSCPYSYVTEEAVRSVDAGELAIEFRAYELFPEPEPLGEPATVDAGLEQAAAFAGIELRAPGFRPRTRKAHEATRFARAADAEAAMRRDIYAAYWSEGRDVARIDVLMELAEGRGLDPEELKIALDIDLHRAAVLHDLEVAKRLRIPGTPAIFIGTGPRATVLLGARTGAEIASAIADARSRDALPDRSERDEQAPD